MDHQQTRSAQRSRASLIVLIVLAFLLMAAAVVLVFSMPDNTALQLPIQTSTPMITADSGFACKESEAQRLYPFGADIIKIDNNRIVCLDILGVERFGINVEFTAPMVSQNEKFFLVSDRGAYAFVLVDSDGEVYRGTAEGRISGASLRSDGYLALIHDTSGGTGLVSLYAPNSGKKLFDCYNPESGYPLSVSFPPDGDFFDIALVNTSGASTRPAIKRYNLDGQQLGQRLPDSTELLPLVSYDQEGRPVLCGASDLVALRYDQDKIVWQARFNQILSVRYHHLGLLALAREKQDGPCSLLCLKSDGKQRFSLPIGDMPTNFDCLGDLAVMGCGTHLLVADIIKGKMILETDIASEIIRVGFAGPGSVTVICRDRVRRLNIPG
jgi:hypothetical protein